MTSKFHTVYQRVSIIYLGETMAKILQEEINKNNILEKDIAEMYKKSHNSYLPAEQIKRQYEIR